MFYDEKFLKQLDHQREKQIYIRITALDLNDLPKEEITGRATGGSINVDGASAVRRSCSLTLLAQEDDTTCTDTYWCYNNKFKLEIGVKNFIDKSYPEIIWFKMGVYIITSFNFSKTTTGLNISISGKDKMCRLNGEVGGNLAMSIDFGTEEVVEEITETDPVTKGVVTSYQTTVTKLPIYSIIQNAVREYGQERTENIIINDLEDKAYELWDYRGDDPMYIFIHVNTAQQHEKEIRNISLDKNTYVFVQDIKNKTYTNKKKLSELAQDSGFQFYSMNTLDMNYNNTATQIQLSSANNGDKYYIAKIEYGETAGYHQTELVYNSDLVLAAGDTITSLLDKIKNMLGEFEYFYDLDGRFVFQKKNTYIQELFSPINGDIIEPTMYASQYSYRFEDEKLFTNIAVNPKIDNLKNDFAVWGTRKSASGDDMPIHVRYAVHKKPDYYILPYDRYNKIPDLYYIRYTPVDLTPKEEEETEDNTATSSIITTTTKKTITAEDNYKSYNGKLYTSDSDYKTFTQSKDNFDENLAAVGYFTIETSVKPVLQIDSTDEGEIDIVNFSGPYKYSYNDQGLLQYQKYSLPSIEDIYYKHEEGYYKQIDDIDLIELPYYTMEPAGTLYKTPFSKFTLIGEDGKCKLCKKTSNNCQHPKIPKLVDWRELIYQMAKDYYANNQKENYLIDLATVNDFVTNGKTGYEQYYSDMQAFWRQLYSPQPTMTEIDNYGEYYSDGDDIYWNKRIHTSPEQLNFWMDFLDTNGEFGKYSIEKIGPRSKVTNETSVKSIYFRETPEILFVVMPKESNTSSEMAYTPIHIQENMEGLFYRSAQGLSAISKVNELMYQHVAITESISLTSIPIYYLQPNTRIYVEGYGDYTLDKITYSLNYNGTMSISGNKIMKQFY